MKLFLKLEPFILPHEARYLGPRDISVTGVGPSQVSLHLLHVPVIAFTRGRGNSGGRDISVWKLGIVLGVESRTM